jgi:6-methylsalicylate decarboxylase
MATMTTCTSPRRHAANRRIVKLPNNIAVCRPGALAFAKPGHITFRSDWPFAPLAAGKLFAASLENYQPLNDRTHTAIEHDNALSLFPRLGTQTPQQLSRSGVNL